MNENEVIEYVCSLGDVVALRPTSGDGTPEIAWGDTFFYYAPSGEVPTGQPFATIITKDYPDEPASGLDRPGAFRVNIHVGAGAFEAQCGYSPRDTPPLDAIDHRRHDVVLPHPVYSRLGWLCVVSPAERSAGTTRDLIAAAHRLAQLRHRRRTHVPADEQGDGSVDDR